MELSIPARLSCESVRIREGLQSVFLFCSDNVSYQCKSWSDILQGWSDLSFFHR